MTIIILLLVFFYNYFFTATTSYSRSHVWHFYRCTFQWFSGVQMVQLQGWELNTLNVLQPGMATARVWRWYRRTPPKMPEVSSRLPSETMIQVSHISGDEFVSNGWENYVRLIIIICFYWLTFVLKSGCPGEWTDVRRVLWNDGWVSLARFPHSFREGQNREAW